MRATKGAIESVSIDRVSGRSDFKTIGHSKPRGICGSGIISLLAGLFSSGWLDPSEKLDRSRDCPFIRVQGRQTGYSEDVTRHMYQGQPFSFTSSRRWASEVNFSLGSLLASSDSRFNFVNNGFFSSEPVIVSSYRYICLSTSSLLRHYPVSAVLWIDPITCVSSSNLVSSVSSTPNHRRKTQVLPGSCTIPWTACCGLWPRWSIHHLAYNDGFVAAFSIPNYLGYFTT